MAKDEEIGVAEAAVLVGTSASTVRRMVASGRLTARSVQAGKRNRLVLRKAEVIEAFSTAHSTAEGGVGSRVASATIKAHGGASDASATLDLVRTLTEQLAAREHQILGLERQALDLQGELRAARAELRSKDEELRELRRENSEVHRELAAELRRRAGSGVLAGFLGSFLKRQ